MKIISFAVERLFFSASALTLFNSSVSTRNVNRVSDSFVYLSFGLDKKIPPLTPL